MVPSPTKFPVSLLLVFVGLSLLVVGMQTVHFGNQPEFHHEISAGPANESELNATLAEYGDSIDRDDVIVEFTELSTASQALVRETITAPEQWVTVRGEGEGIHELQYPGDVYGLGASDYYLLYHGEYYELSVYGDSGFPGFEEFLSAAMLFLLAIPAMLLGLVFTDSGRVTASVLAPLSVLTGLSIAEFGWFGLTGHVELVLAGLAVCTFTAIPTWWISGTVAQTGEISIDRDRLFRRRVAITSVAGSGGLFLLFVINVGLLGLADLLELAMLGLLAFTIPAAIAWHGIDQSVRDT